MNVAPRPRSLRLGTAAALTLALALSACSSGSPKQTQPADSPSPSASSATSTPPPPPQPSRLSGRMGKPNGPVYAVKIDNTAHAHPQAGLSKADVVYVEQVEGGVTRLAAIYSSSYPTYVGPVRSARITDVDLLRQYGTVGLIYSGSQDRLAGPLGRAALHLVSFDQDHTGYTRSRSRTRPYDVIGTFDRLRKRAGRVSTPPVMGYTFGPVAGAPGRPAKSFSASYPAARVSGVWSAKQKRWLVSMDGRPDMAAEGGQLGPTTFVVQFATVKPSIYHDVNHVNTPQTLTVGKGRALVFRDGRVYEGAWSRAKPGAVTTYTIAGHPATFAPGQVWVALLGRDRHVTVG